ncbi:MAG: glycosyltransferase [Streptosporangiales bacterium]
MKPAVTVVVPTKDRPELLRRAVEAVLAQDYGADVHCLVVYDGATPDRTLERLKGNRRVTVTSNTRVAGLAGARNTGILLADTELVAFCDDDDAWLPGKLSAQVELLTADPTAVLATCGIRIEYGDRTVDRSLASVRVELDDLLRKRLPELHPSSFLFRRAKLVELGLVDEKLPGSYAEDYELLLRAARAGSIVNVPDVHLLVRWHRASHFMRRWDTIADALQYLLASNPQFASVRSGEARITGQIAFARAAQGQRREAVRWVRRTVARNPREARAYLALAVASGAVRPDTVLSRLHRRGRSI